MRDKVKNLRMSGNSSLIIGEDCILEDVFIDGHCEIKDDVKGEKLSLKVEDKVYKQVKDIDNKDSLPYLKIRGYDVLWDKII